MCCAVFQLNRSRLPATSSTPSARTLTLRSKILKLYVALEATPVLQVAGMEK